MGQGNADQAKVQNERRDLGIEEADLLQRIRASIEDLAVGGHGHSISTRDIEKDAQAIEVHDQIRSRLLEMREAYEARLRRAEGLAVAGLAALPDPIFILTTEGKVELQNTAAAKLMANLEDPDRLCRVLEKLGQDALEEDRDSIPVTLEDALNLKLVSGGLVCFLPKVIRIQHPQGTSTNVTVILQEVTEFQEADDRKTTVLGALSHELRSPLASLRMAISLMLEQRMGNLNERQEEMLGVARKDLDDLINLLNEVMELNRFQRDQQPAFGKQDPRELLSDCVDECRDLIEEKGVEIRYQIEPDLPPVRVEKQQLALALRHLLTNALNNTPKAGSIVLGAYPAEDEDCVSLFVKDSGKGMSAAERGRVFLRGHHLSNPSKHGLGLSVAHEIVISHNGSLECLSRFGEGTTFTAVLPMWTEDGSPAHDCRRTDAGEVSCAAREAEKIADS